VPARDENGGMRHLQALHRVLLVHPRWLAEVSWPLIAGTLGIALGINLQNYPEFFTGDGSWRHAAIWSLIRSFEGLTLLFTGAILLHLRSVGWWRPLALTVAVIIACLAGGALAVAVVPPDLSDIPDMPATTKWIFRALAELRLWPLIAAAWYLVDRARRRAAMLREEEAMRHRLDTGMVEARLQMLEAQVEPHFIFNTLANIRRLCQIDPARARSTVDRFAAYLRASLPQMRDSAPTLGREVDLAAAYLDVQNVRMGRRLSYAIDVDDALRSQPFPRMMLISLVENAIKHGLNPSIEGGNVAISAAAQDGVLRVRVAARPVDGAANEALLRLVAKATGVSRSRVVLRSGTRGRAKIVEIDGIEPERLRSVWPGLDV